MNYNNFTGGCENYVISPYSNSRNSILHLNASMQYLNAMPQCNAVIQGRSSIQCCNLMQCLHAIQRIQCVSMTKAAAEASGRKGPNRCIESPETARLQRPECPETVRLQYLKLFGYRPKTHPLQITVSRGVSTPEPFRVIRYPKPNHFGS